MANSKLLKEAIADAKAVRETAIANAKIALEEAFTPRLQSILSQKLQQEMEDEEEADMNEDFADADNAPDEDASDIGDGDNKQPSDYANDSSELAQGNPDTEVETAEVGSEEDETEVVAEGEEEDGDDSMEEGEYNADGEEEIVAEEDEDELDLDEIIKELEGELEEEDGDEEMHEEESEEEAPVAEEEDEKSAEIAELKARLAELEGDDEEMHEEDEMDSEEDINLDEILREMGYGEEEEEEVNEEEEDKVEEMEKELDEAYKVIKSLKSTINEVNLLNAKLLYTNKLFRAYDLNNEQKMKVVETLDRTGNVREVKLVFSTLAESFKFNGTAKKQKSSKINESFASKPVASTAPKKSVITESTNLMAERFKQLANIK
jgi:hypothetical protein